MDREIEIYTFNSGKCIATLTLEDGILERVVVSCSRNSVYIRCSEDSVIDPDLCFDLALEIARSIAYKAIEMTKTRIITALISFRSFHQGGY